MTPTELQNSSKWEMVWSDSAVSEPYPPPFDDYWKPLRAFECPVLFTSRFLLVKTVCQIPEGKQWKFAGNLLVFQKYPAGLSGVKTEIKREYIPLNSSRLVQIPDVAPQYEVILRDAFWLRNLYLEIYEYTGAYA